MVVNEFNPLVSIVIPVYNGSNYMREAIDSALSQTYKNIEVIVVNDGSTDSTEEIAHSYGDRIRYFSKENGGVSTALNLAIKNAKGEYISWLSHDDVYYPEKIEKQVEELEKLGKVAVLYSDYELIDEKSQTISIARLNHKMLTQKPEYALLRGSLNGITLLFPKEAIEKNGFFDEKLRCTQDYFMWSLLFKECVFVHMPEVLARHRIHPEQDSQKSPLVLAEGNALWSYLMDLFPKNKRKELEGNDFFFFNEMALFLNETSYIDARHVAMQKAESYLMSLSWCSRLFYRIVSFFHSIILRDKIFFILFSPRKFAMKRIKKILGI